MSNKDEGASVQNSLAGSETNAHTHYKAETPSEPKKTVEPCIPVMMSSLRFDKKPSTSMMGKIGTDCIKHGFRFFTPDSFCEHIETGHAFVPACLQNERKNENFVCQQIFCLDFDELTELEAGEYKEQGVNVAIINYALQRGLNVVCLYPTFNYSAENPKCRLVIDNGERITDKKERDEVMLYLLKAFAHFKPDTSCKDAARVFFGTNKRGCRLWQE